METKSKTKKKILIVTAFPTHGAGSGALITTQAKSYVENGDEQKLVEKYKTQLEMYKKALEISKDKKVDKMYIYPTFLEKEIVI